MFTCHFPGHSQVKAIHWVMRKGCLAWLLSCHSKGNPLSNEKGVSCMIAFLSLWRECLAWLPSCHFEWNVLHDCFPVTLKGIHWVMRKGCLAWLLSCHSIKRIQQLQQNPLSNLKGNVLHDWLPVVGARALKGYPMPLTNRVNSARSPRVSPGGYHGHWVMRIPALSNENPLSNY